MAIGNRVHFLVRCAAARPLAVSRPPLQPEQCYRYCSATAMASADEAMEALWKRIADLERDAKKSKTASDEERVALELEAKKSKTTLDEVKEGKVDNSCRKYQSTSAYSQLDGFKCPP